MAGTFEELVGVDHGGLTGLKEYRRKIIMVWRVQGEVYSIEDITVKSSFRIWS